MVVYNRSCVFGSGDTTFARNGALDNAGGILVLGNCTVKTILAMNQLANRHNGIFYL